MPPRQRSRFWRILRIYFRRVRMTVWLVLFVLVGTLVYLNQIGLPGFIKRPLLDKLQARGIDLQFSRLRLSWWAGIVADDVRFGRADERFSPQLTLARVQVQLNYRALLHRQLQIDSLKLHRGRLVWPVLATNQPTRELSITNLEAQLRFLPNDEWALDHFEGAFAGATFLLSGSITNASAIRDWKFLQAKPQQPPTPLRAWQNRLGQLADTLELIQFPAPPELRLDLRGDARDLQSFQARLQVLAKGADTPWGKFSQGQFTARLFPATTNELSRAELTLEAAHAQTRWAATTNLQLTIHLASSEGQPNLVNGDLVLLAGQAETQWATATNAQLTAQWVHALTNPIPLTGQGEFRCDQAATLWGCASNLEFRGHFAKPASASSSPDPAFAWWTNLQPYLLSWEARLTDLRSPKLTARAVSGGGSWGSPELTVTNLHAEIEQGALLGVGRLDAHAGLNIATRALQASLSSDIDPHQLEPLLTPGARRWLAPYSWSRPPQVQGDVALILPAWTNRAPDWRAEVQPTLRLQGEFALTHGGSYSNVPFATAHSHISYSNLCWHLPDLTATRPEGRIQAEHRASDRTKDFYWHINSTVDPRILRPLLDPGAQRGLDLLTLSNPPAIDAELWGRFHDHERLGFRARVALTNFAFRGQSADALQVDLHYTNRVLQIFQPRIQRGDQLASADGLVADFNAQLVFLTNGFSTTDPLVIARAIGPKIGRAIEPYQFLQPPTAHVYGTIPMHGEDNADLHFELQGGPFRWLNFNVPSIAGQIHWLGQQLTLTNITTDFYGGRARGQAQFQFHRGPGGADYQFSVQTTGTQLHALMTDLSDQPNKLEGTLNATLHITRANTDDPDHVFGSGSAELRDGLIWDIPLFGVFSPALDSFAPGLGSSRANAGSCSFTITNSVIHSENLEVHASGMRLQYRGTVDFHYRVNARVEAELLRDMPVLGPVVSTVLTPVTKMFEYKVTGTLQQPKLAPVYIFSKLVLLPFQLPFHPVRTLKNLLPEDTTARTNAPAPLKP